MAPTDGKMKNKELRANDGSWKGSKSNAQGLRKKKKWVPEQKKFQGSLKEGQGFAFRRKQKVQHEYNKLLRKEKKKKNNNPESSQLYKDEYPEHLRHLYLAEAEKLKNEAWTNRMNRSKLRMRRQEGEGGEEEEVAGERDDDDDAPPQGEAADPEPDVAASVDPEAKATPEKESLPMSNRMRKKLLKKTSYQKTKEEFETMKEKKRKKREAFLKNKQQREEAIAKYKQKKMETYQILSKKTKKGQPNLNLQMDYLLQKIQGTRK